MKRPLTPSASGMKTNKKAKAMENDEDVEGLGRFDDNLLFEVLKHVDARTLAMAGCVNKQWHKTAQDERLWELICTKQWANTGCGEQQLRSVVLALGGFRRLHALYLFPLSKPQQLQQLTSSSSSSSSSSAWGPTVPQMIRSKPLRLGKDETFCSLRSGNYNLLCWDTLSTFQSKRLYNNDIVLFKNIALEDSQVCATVVGIVPENQHRVRIVI
ncbi:hypothetical protein JHK86_014372 [Glycine max]|nr:hypothetical protein JHK86_014372 [Glycine max]